MVSTSSAIDLSYVLTLDPRAIGVARPAIRASIDSASRARTTGVSSEIIVIHSRDDSRAAEEAAHWAAKNLESTPRFIGIERFDDGAARQFGIDASHGTYIALFDARDITSIDFPTAAIALLDRTTFSAVAHPEVVVGFGRENYTWSPPSSRHDAPPLGVVLTDDPWTSTTVVSREVARRVPVRSLHPDDGFGSATWAWNLDLLAAGVHHLPTPDTISFLRVRPDDGRTGAYSATVLPQLDLDAISRTLGSRRVALEEGHGEPLAPVPGGSGRLLAPARRVRSAIDARLTNDDRRRLRALAARVRRPARSVAPIEAPIEAPITLGRRFSSALAHISQCEPGASWAAFHIDELDERTLPDGRFGQIVYDAVSSLAECGEAIVAVPWLGVGGGDIVARNYAVALNNSPEYSGRTSILATYRAENTAPELLPDGIPFVQMPTVFYEFEPSWRQRIVAQIVSFLRPRLVLSINCFHITDSMHFFATPLGRSTELHLSFFALGRLAEGYPASPITDEGLRPFVHEATGLITDNSVSEQIATELVSIERSRVRVHPQPAFAVTPRHPPARSRIPDDGFRVVWPHRLDAEKRPDSVIRIARRIRELSLPISIDVWGSFVISPRDEELLERLRESGIAYRGPFTGGLPALEAEGYDALLLTSESEGLPLTLVQALFLGIPSVASNVGGVSDIIIDGETGLLSSGPDDIDGFVMALDRLRQQDDLRDGLRARGYEHVRSRHSWESFQSLVDAEYSRGVAASEHVPLDRA